MPLKSVVAASCLSMTLWMQPPTASGQAVVTNISEELWQKLPKDYYLSNCGFTPPMNVQNRWWACELYGKSEYPAFTWMMPIKENGDLGDGFLISAMTGENNPWVVPLAFGQNGLLARNADDNPIIAALAFPSSTAQDLITPAKLWQYFPPKSLDASENLFVVQAEPTLDGGYVLLMRDLSEKADDKNQDRFQVVRLSEQGKPNWQYQYNREVSASKAVEPILLNQELEKDFFITSDQKIVIYGYTHQPTGGYEAFLICLDAAGQEISTQFFDTSYWYNNMPVEWPEHGFGFLNQSYDKEKNTYHLYVRRFNQRCQKETDQPLNLPSHHFNERIDNNIKATVLSPTRDLWIIYLQKQFFIDGDEQSGLYLAQINQQGKVVQDIALITGQDKNQDYLRVFAGEGMDFDYLKITLAILPRGNEILVSIHNMGAVDPETGYELQPNYPLMYRIKLP